MLSKWYSPGIRIYGKKGTSFYTGAELGADAAKAYIATVDGWLKKLKKLATGLALTQEIDNSGHICYIMEADVPTSNKAMLFSNEPAPSTYLPGSVAKTQASQRLLQKQLDGMAQPITPPKKILIADKVTQAAAYNSLKNQITAIGAPSGKAQTSNNFNDLINNMTNAGIAVPHQKIAACAGVNLVKVMDWVLGNDSPDRNQYFKIVAAYYQYFPRGNGADTVVLLAGGADPGTPDYIQLGHELVHAWRMMTGRRIVGGNTWEEEAMTVGLTPFADLPFTENALRRDAKLPRRLKYGGMVAASSDSMGVHKNNVESAPTLFAPKKGLFG